MTRTKASVKRRHQRRERDAEKARLREAREAEQQQQAERDGDEEVEEAAAVQDGDAHNASDREEAERHRITGKVEEEEEEAEEEEEDGAEEEAVVDEEAREIDGEEGQLLLTDYEKQREQRLKENAAKLATLNLTSLASSLRPSTSRPQRQSSIKRKKDVDYVPSSSSDSEDYNNEDIVEHTRSHKQQDNNGDLDGDQALQQAIAMSLDTPAGNVAATRSRGLRAQRNKRQVSEKKRTANKKRKGPQGQFTVDEIASMFAIIDEQGNGKFSVAELERVARSHDFTWSKQEIADMIDIFDNNKDGQLDLSEFQSIFGRINMLRMRVA